MKWEKQLTGGERIIKRENKKLLTVSNAAKKSRGTKSGKGIRSDDAEAIVPCTVGLVEWEGEIQLD